jgi:hypothetical protein
LNQLNFVGRVKVKGDNYKARATVGERASCKTKGRKACKFCSN